MLFVIFLLRIFLIVILILISSYFLNSFFTNAPFVPVKRRILIQIIRSLKLTPKSILYDLGCGDARVLVEAINSVNDIKARGVEKNIIVYLWSKWRTRNIPVKIYCADIKNISLKDATHIYLYLCPKTMDELLMKLKKECSPGTRIVSCSFIFPELVPNEIIDLPIAKDKMCKKLYVYILK
jgi:hypothetical protein